MSIITSSSTIIDGKTLGSYAESPFMPAGDSLSVEYCRYNGHRVAVTFKQAGIGYMLKAFPDYQIPRGCRSIEDWNQTMFGLDRDDAVLLSMDPDDGEVTRTYHGTDFDDQAIAAAIDECVTMVVDLYQDVVTFVRSRA